MSKLYINKIHFFYFTLKTKTETNITEPQTTLTLPFKGKPEHRTSKNLLKTTAGNWLRQSRLHVGKGLLDNGKKHHPWLNN